MVTNRVHTPTNINGALNTLLRFEHTKKELRICFSEELDQDTTIF